MIERRYFWSPNETGVEVEVDLPFLKEIAKSSNPRGIIPQLRWDRTVVLKVPTGVIRMTLIKKLCVGCGKEHIDVVSDMSGRLYCKRCQEIEIATRCKDAGISVPFDSIKKVDQWIFKKERKRLQKEEREEQWRLREEERKKRWPLQEERKKKLEGEKLQKNIAREAKNAEKRRLEVEKQEKKKKSENARDDKIKKLKEKEERKIERESRRAKIEENKKIKGKYLNIESPEKDEDICKILHHHVDVLKDDPERLSTDFIKRISRIDGCEDVPK